MAHTVTPVIKMEDEGEMIERVFSMVVLPYIWIDSDPNNSVPIKNLRLISKIVKNQVDKLSTVGRMNLFGDKHHRALEPTELAHVHTRMQRMNMLKVFGDVSVDFSLDFFISEYAMAASSSLAQVKYIDVFVHDSHISSVSMAPIINAASSLEELSTNMRSYSFYKMMMEISHDLPKFRALRWHSDGMDDYIDITLTHRLVRSLVSHAPLLEVLSVPGMQLKKTSEETPPHTSLRSLRLDAPSLYEDTYRDIDMVEEHEENFGYVTPPELLAVHRFFPRLHTLTGVILRLCVSDFQTDVLNFLSLLSVDSYVSLALEEEDITNQTLNMCKHRKLVCVKSLRLQYKCKADAQKLADRLAQPEIAAAFPCVHTVFLDAYEYSCSYQESRGAPFPSPTMMNVLPLASQLVLCPETTWLDDDADTEEEAEGDLEVVASKAIFDLACRMPTARKSKIFIYNVPTNVVEQAHTLLRTAGINNICSLIHVD